MVPDVDTNDYTLRNQLTVLENKLEALVSELESLQGIIDEATKENIDSVTVSLWSTFLNCSNIILLFRTEQIDFWKRDLLFYNVNVCVHSIDGFADRGNSLFLRFVFLKNLWGLLSFSSFSEVR